MPFHRYELKKRIGAGRQGEVWKAEDLQLGRTVAIKLIHPREGCEELVWREAQSLARVNHPNVVRLLDAFEHQWKLWLVMELVTGETLGARLASQECRRLPVCDALSIMRRVATGLDVVHSKGVFHRDIRPENILLAGGDSPLLIDFGLASAAPPNARGYGGDGLGDPDYRAPELADAPHGKTSPQSDIYALGLVLYQAMSGRLPDRQLQHQHQRAPSRVLGMSPQPWDDTVLRAIDPDPSARFKSAGEFAAHLFRCMRVEGHRVGALLDEGWSMLQDARRETAEGALQRVDDALLKIRSAVRDQPTPRGYFYLGCGLEARRDSRSAEAAWEKALKDDESFGLPRYYWAWSLAKRAIMVWWQSEGRANRPPKKAQDLLVQALYQLREVSVRGTGLGDDRLLRLTREVMSESPREWPLFLADWVRRAHSRDSALVRDVPHYGKPFSIGYLAAAFLTQEGQIDAAALRSAVESDPFLWEARGLLSSGVPSSKRGMPHWRP